MTEWHEGQGLLDKIYWRDSANELRWHVSFCEARTLGTVQGQIIEDAGWYWYTADLHGNKFSSMAGPFSFADAAMADCEVAHR